MTEFEQRFDILIAMLLDPNITINPSGMEKIKENLLAAAKKDAIDKACQWLRTNYDDIGIRYMRGCGVEDEIENLKEYMEQL